MFLRGAGPIGDFELLPCHPSCVPTCQILRTRPAAPDEPPADYVARVNRAIDHVLANLDGDVSLAAVARAAHFSPFHFHRVFLALVGETLGQFVKRLQLERALSMMSHAPRRSLTEIALAKLRRLSRSSAP